MTPLEVRGRRRWLGIGVAAIAAGAGAGFAWWRQQDLSADTSELSAAAEGFWQMSFEKPDAGVLQMASLRGKPLVLNFWATWCPPCVKEMPVLDEFARKSGWQVLGLAIDKPEPVREYLKRVPVGFAIALAGPDGVGLARQFGNAGGQLPYSVVFDSSGRVVARHLGIVDEQLLARWTSRFA